MKQDGSFNVEVEASTLLKSLHGAPYARSILMHGLLRIMRNL